MSRPKKTDKDQTKVVQMDGTQAGNVAVAEPEPETPFDQPKANGIPDFKPEKQQPLKKPTFFQKVAKVAAEDWGTRAYIYVYCWEPICNLKMGGENKYLVRLSQPIFDEQALMVDYGSGKYHLKLVLRKPGIEDGDTVDTTEIEIYNPKYPPKIPRAVWMNDPRNERWAALLPKEEPAAPANGATVLMDSMKVLNEIRRDAREEMAPATPPVIVPPNRVGEMIEMVSAIKTLIPAPAPATDNKVLDTVMALMTAQLTASGQEVRELRQQVMTLLTRPAEKSDTFESMVDQFEKIAPKIQGLLGLGGDKLTDVVHGRRRPWYEELAISALPQLAPGFNALMGAAANSFFAPKNGAPQLGAPIPAPTSQAALPAPADPLQALRQKVGLFMQSNIKPLQKHFEDFIKGVSRDEDDADMGKKDGTDFAYWVNESFGMDDLKAARELGSANIKAMFQQSPYWVAIAPYEGKFSEFLDQVLSFTPDEDEKEEDKPVDLTKE